MEDLIRNVVLSFPCREDWNKFEVVAGGRLCQSCKFIVRDFRDCKANELSQATRSGRRVCGIFRKEQLAPSFLKAAAVAMAIAPLSSCQTEQPRPANQQDVEWMGDVPVAGQPVIPEEEFEVGTMGMIITSDSTYQETAWGVMEKDVDENGDSVTITF